MQLTPLPPPNLCMCRGSSCILLSLKTYRRHFLSGLAASGGGWCFSTTPPATALLSAASFPERPRLGASLGGPGGGSAPSGQREGGGEGRGRLSEGRGGEGPTEAAAEGG